MTMDISVSGISFSFQPSELYEQTSALQYVNSQLVAHGFAKSPGLLLDGLSVEEGEKVIKCFTGMLSQRIEDVKRTEELSSKIRQLTYENDRLQSMYRTAVETEANAEREMNLHKSKLVALQKQHASDITSHKQTSSELQKTRTALQYLRSTTQNELKRKDKEVERILERWNKVADSQTKLSGINNGLHCANYAVGTEELVRGKGIMEEALEQAEEARCGLVKENEGFRSVIFGTAKMLQNITYDVASRRADGHVEEPPHLTPTAVFAPPTSLLSHSDNAHTKFRELFSALRDAVSALPIQEDLRTSSKPQTSDEDVAKLNEIITSLRTELEQRRQSSNRDSTVAQKVFDRFTKDVSKRLCAAQHMTTDLSMELICQPEQDELRNALENRAKELETERARFTDATIKLGKEKAAFEEERMKLIEEKRKWTVEQMLAELPPTPGPDPDLVSISISTSKQMKVKLKPPSPRRASGSKGSSRSPKKGGMSLKLPNKKTTGTLARRVTFEMGNGPEEENVESVSAHPATKQLKMRRESKLFETVDVLYDPKDRYRGDHRESDKQDSRDQESAVTEARGEELYRSTTPEDPPPVMLDTGGLSAIPSTPTPAPASASAPAVKPRTSLPLVLPTTFTLPPPSPASSLSLQPFPIGPSSPSTSLSSTQAPAPTQVPAQAVSMRPSSSDNFSNNPSISTTSSFDKVPLMPSRLFPSPRTPRAVFSTHTKRHAYSPAKPSPLSRILMIADSPPSPPSPCVETILEEDEGDSAPLDAESLGIILMKGLGLEPIDEPSPLRERTGNEASDSGVGDKDSSDGQKGGEDGTIDGAVAVPVDKNVMKEKERRFTAKEKGKGLEKENVRVVTQVQVPNPLPVTKPALKMVASGKSKVAGPGAVSGTAPRASAPSRRAVSKKSTLVESSASKAVRGSAGASGGAKVKLGVTGRAPVPVGNVRAGKVSQRMM